MTSLSCFTKLEEASNDSLFVIHAGANDVSKTRSEELLDVSKTYQH